MSRGITGGSFPGCTGRVSGRKRTRPSDSTLGGTAPLPKCLTSASRRWADGNTSMGRSTADASSPSWVCARRKGGSAACSFPRRSDSPGEWFSTQRGNPGRRGSFPQDRSGRRRGPATAAPRAGLIKGHGSPIRCLTRERRHPNGWPDNSSRRTRVFRGMRAYRDGP